MTTALKEVAAVMTESTSTMVRPTGPVWRRLLKARDGAIAPIFVILLPTMIAVAGFGLDMGRYAIAQNQLQIAADAAALAAAQHVSDKTQVVSIESVALSYGQLNLPANLAGAITAADVTAGKYSTAAGFSSGSSNPNAVRVTLTRSAARSNRFSSIFGTYFYDTVAATAVAVKPEASNYEPPQSTNLDNEAGDYNEIYAYCYDYAGTGTPASRRTQMSLISNNMGSGNIVSISSGVISVAPAANPTWPDCRGAGLSISFRQRNIRHAKSIPSLWQNPGNAPGRAEYNYYTDTRIAAGRENFDGLEASIVETVLCDTADQCDSRLPSFIGVKGRNRSPSVATDTCAPGKFMYFGWEDRPPGQAGASGSWTDPAWTDKDYDDIRLLMKCPKGGQLGNAYVRLVR